MGPNLAGWDRGIRAVAGVGLIVAGVARGLWSDDFFVLGVLGLLLLVTAVAGVDPLYRVYGITTQGGVRRLPCDEHGESCRPEFHRRH